MAAPLALEFLVMNRPYDGIRLFMETATVNSTVANLGDWIKAQLSLHFSSEVDLYLGNYGVVRSCNNSQHISEFLCHTDPIPVHVRRISNVHLTFPNEHNILLEDTVQMIKQKVEGVFGIPVADQTVYSQGVALPLRDADPLQGQVDPKEVSLCIMSNARDQLLTAAVRTLTGKVINIDVSGSCTVAEMKLLIQMREGIPPDQQRLIHAGCQLGDDEQVLEDLPCWPYPTFHLVLRLRGGGGDFCDVSREDALQTFQWAKEGPKWRSVYPGLCIEGTCRNRKCAAHKKMVIDNFRFQAFDLLRDPSQCPMCSQPIKPEKPAFNNCWYQIVGQKAKSSSIFRTPWQRVGDEYVTYDEHKAGKVKWDELKIFIRPLMDADSLAPSAAPCVPLPVECAICFGRLTSTAGAYFTTCKHVFHTGCVEQWGKTQRQTGVQPTCPLCRSSLQ